MSEVRVWPECEAAQAELNAYLDGELPAAEAAAIERHLEDCAACRAEAALLRLVTRSLRLAARPEPSEAMRQQLLARVSAELPPRTLEIVCVERHGDRVIRRREVRTYHGPDRLRRLEPVSQPVAAPVIQQFRRVLTDRPNCYQVIESHYGKEFDDGRA